MAANELSISDWHEDPRFDNEKMHKNDLMFAIDYEPGDPNYGADADGNRGISVPGYWYPDEDPPERCSVCGHVYTEEEKEDLHKAMVKEADEYTAEG